MSEMLLRSLKISVEGRPDDAVVSVGQCILIEGDDDDNPYVAQLLELFSDGKKRHLLKRGHAFRMLYVYITRLKEHICDFLSQ